MNPFEQMELKKSSFTKKEMIVYDFFVENIDDILRDTATQLAEKHNISQASISRFCQKLGYHGYNDFKYDVYKYQKIGNESTNPASIMDYYAKLINLIPNAISEEQFTELAQLIVDAKFIAINGFHKSALPAQLLEMNLAKVSKHAVYVPYDRSHTLAQTLTKQDLAIYFSATGIIYREHVEALNDMDDDKRPITVLITMADKSPMRNKVDHVIWLPNYKNQGYPQYLETQVVFMIFVDLLTNYIAQLLN